MVVEGLALNGGVGADAKTGSNVHAKIVYNLG